MTRNIYTLLLYVFFCFKAYLVNLINIFFRNAHSALLLITLYLPVVCLPSHVRDFSAASLTRVDLPLTKDCGRAVGRRASAAPAIPPPPRRRPSMEGDPPPEAPFSIGDGATALALAEAPARGPSMAAGCAVATARGPASVGEHATATPSGSLSPAGGDLAGQVMSAADLDKAVANLAAVGTG